MERQLILDKLRLILVRDLDVNLKLEDIAVDVPLYEGGIGLDSISIVNLIGLTETHFNFHFEDNEISPLIFANLNALCSFILKKTESERASSMQ